MNFKFSKIGDIINLEKPLKFGERVSGHYVQGHIDTISKIMKISFIGKSWFMNFKLLKEKISLNNELDNKIIDLLEAETNKIKNYYGIFNI